MKKRLFIYPSIIVLFWALTHFALKGAKAPESFDPDSSGESRYQAVTGGESEK